MDRLEYRRYLGLGEQDHEPRDWNHVTLADLYGQSQAQHRERREWQEEAMRHYRPDAGQSLRRVMVARLLVEVAILVVLVVIAFQ